jgi:uncharacterized protein (TIGR03084 family)
MSELDYPALLGDLAAEQAALDTVVGALDADGWATPTPAAGWDVRDSIAHLAFTEDCARLALEDPPAFAARQQALLASDAPEPLVGDGRSLRGDEVLAWWRDARATVDARLVDRDARDRIPWFAGPMSAASFATARIMETWAHGQDVRDALGLAPVVSGRLRHVAELGVRTRPYAYRARGLDVPATPVRVELVGPDGQRWAWGEPDAADVVTGPALDFCLAVTQRAHPLDTALVLRGAAAREWMGIAQAFAGPPTDHRPPSGG